MSAAGLQRYRILLSGEVPAAGYCCQNSIVVLHDINSEYSPYELNAIFYVERNFSLDQPHFETSNAKLLTEFLRNNKFKKLEFENDVLELLLAAKENWKDKHHGVSLERFAGLDQQDDYI